MTEQQRNHSRQVSKAVGVTMVVLPVMAAFVLATITIWKRLSESPGTLQDWIPALCIMFGIIAWISAARRLITGKWQ